MENIIQHTFKDFLSSEGLLHQELYLESKEKTELVSKWVLDMREKSIERALIKLGWTPPTQGAKE